MTIFAKFSPLCNVSCYKSEGIYHLTVKDFDGIIKGEFTYTDAEDLLDKLIELDVQGNRIPQFVIDAVGDEFIPW